MLIHNAEVTGSLKINNVPFNSGSFSGSFRGDGSQLTGITGASTASYVEYSNVGNKPALVSGSSQITYSGLSGIPSGIVSGSSQVTYSGLTGIPAGIVSGSDQITGFGIFATTGSNQFNGSQAITGSLTVTGQVVAQTLNVQQVTSSIVYSSGSNIFGNSLSNTQQFTGSVSVTGSLTVTTTGTELQVTSTGVNLGNIVTDNHNVTGSLRVTGSMAVTGASTFSSTVGINGVTSPAAELQVGKSSDVVIAMSNSSSVTSGPRGSIAWYNSSVSSVATIRAAAVTDNVGTELQFFTRPAGGSLTQVMTLDASGRLGINTTSPLGVLDISSGLRTGTLSGLFIGADADTTAGTRTNNTRKLGMIASPHYQNASGSVFGIAMDNQVSNNFIYIGGGYSGYNAATAIVFSTGGTTTTETGTERMRITSGGNVGIGTATPTTYSLNGRHFELNDAGGGYSFIHNNTTTVKSFYAINESALLAALFTFSNHPLTLGTNNTERMRINSSGVVLINNTYASPSGVLNTFKTPVSSTYVDQIVVQGTGNYPSLRLGTYDAYDGVIATTGNDLRILSGLNVSSENHNIRFYTGFNGAGGAAENNERMRIEYNGNVGIGTTTINSERLTVRQTTGNASALYVLTSGVTTGQSYGLTIEAGTNNSDRSFAVFNQAGNTEYLKVRGDGFLFSSPTYNNTFGSSANMYVNTDGSFGRATSSLKYKTDIKNYDKGLAEVMQIRPVYYKSINEREKDLTFAGLIAEEIEELGLTEFVQYAPDGSPDALSYQNMIALAFKAIQELKSENDTLKSILQRNNIS